MIHTKKHIVMMAMLIMLAMSVGSHVAAETTYTHLDRADGLSSNNVLSLTCLADGRMVVTTDSGIDLYDGNGFRHFHRPDIEPMPLSLYHGHYHLYADCRDRLWIKDWQAAWCIDMRTETFVTDYVLPLHRYGMADTPADLFVDTESRHLWVVGTDSIVDTETHTAYHVDASKGTIQDLDVKGGVLYLFHDSGIVTCQPLGDGRGQTVSVPSTDQYPATSMIVYDTASQSFLQIRSGHLGYILQQFDLSSREWHHLLSTDYALHTICLSSPGTVYISSERGLWICDTRNRTVSLDTDYSIVGDRAIGLDMNTLACDHQGGLWLGSGHQGLLYTHPLRSRSGTYRGMYPGAQALDADSLTYRHRHSQELMVPGPLKVLLIGLSVSDSTLNRYEGRAIAYVDTLRLHHDYRSLSVVIGCANYALPEYTSYQYTLVHGTDTIRQSSGTSTFQTVDRKGLLHLSYNYLRPGHYDLIVSAAMSTVAPPAGSMHLHIIVQPPWWQTPWAYTLYVVVALLVVGAIFYVTMRLRMRHIDRLHREAMLLARIQTLMEAQQTPPESPDDTPAQPASQSEASTSVADPATASSTDPATAAKPTTLSADDEQFLSRAIGLVESNLSTQGYTVEQLAADLCMERTGLYKRLTMLMNTSPSLFIRSIRLRRAATLLSTTDLPVGEVAERAGFCNASHLSRLFVAEFGCKPSEYRQKSTSVS